ncbi:S8 family serine peptidase [Neiella marina]|uniref:S8 family serine peptidase n=1 Tax=Neiella holothuriorum TaxID=2870530 RepID=A0ABS7EIQ5_9GAMM|nr:S8 family serine peptidase [Neiella holothuriorum]MBW8192211.1 S8 family serine peptidase [Neiella holothuriorum]
MTFKKTMLAMALGAICLPAAASVLTDSHSPKQNVAEERSRYMIHLQSEEGASTLQVQKAQDEAFQAILQMDPQASLTSRAKLVANFITVQTTDAVSEQLKTLPGVKQIVATTTSSYVAPANTTATFAIRAESTDEAVVPLAPYLGDETAGAGATVAILSTGIDYTSSFLGGSGVYGDDGDEETPPPPGSYLEALESGAIEFSGFPTDVVAGGWDFAGENYGNDGNPIDQHYEYVDYNGWEYPTGTGTALASLVHQLAPGAQLYAYKVYNISPASWDPEQMVVAVPRLDTVVQSIEHALDPNQDGDTSDHVDVLLMDAAGAAAFFNMDGSASTSILDLIVEKASALGTTIVTHSGVAGEYGLYGEASAKHRYWLSVEGAPTSVVTVGSVVRDGETTFSPEWAPLGPVRGSLALKPEVVSYADKQPVSAITSADTPVMSYKDGAIWAAARVAAAAAVVKGKYPQMGPAEIKAMLANTATNNGLLESAHGEEAELIAVGHGVENVEAAAVSPVFIWDSANSQPYLQFGMHEVTDTAYVVKKAFIRNVSDTAQTYTISHTDFSDRGANSAVLFSYPNTVSIPAGGATEITITAEIDASKLPVWPLKQTSDFTDELIKQTEMNGYLVFSSETNPDLKVGWMLKARPATTISKSTLTSEFPIYKGWDPDLGETVYDHLAWAKTYYPDDEWGYGTYSAYVSSFTNESESETTFEAYPVIIHKSTFSDYQDNFTGHYLQTIGGGVFDEPACTVTGKKFSLAVKLLRPANTTMARYLDKIGEPIFFYDLFYQSVVENYGWDESFEGSYLWDENEIFNQLFVSINEAGQPATFFIDYNKEYNWEDPAGRYTESSLPTKFTGDGSHVVSQFCLEDIYHHELDSIDDFDQNLGVHVETDRDVSRDKGEPIAQFNPVRGGYYNEEETCGTDWFGNEVCDKLVQDKSVRAGFAPADETELTDLVPMSSYTAKPGEEVRIIAARSQLGSIGIGSESFADESLPKFLVISTDDNFAQVGYAGFLDADGSIIADVRAGQVMHVQEDAEAGTVVGKIELDTQGFFGYPDSEWESMELIIVDTVEGTPFAINQQTKELYVIDPTALDHEIAEQISLRIVSRLSNNVGMTTPVIINVANVNDMAPTVSESVAANLSVMNITFDPKVGHAFSYDISGLFSDAEGDMVTISVASSSLDGVSIEQEALVGSIEEPGEYQVVLSATDGVHETQHTMSIVATKSASSGSGGGSMGFILLPLLGLLYLRRCR